MKFPEVLESLFPKKSDGTQVYVSLYLDVHSVAVSFWSMGTGGAYKILAVEHAVVPEDSWDARSDTVDRLLGLLEEKTGHTDVAKAILGLPTTYLTPTGEIRKEVRTEIKNLTRQLELDPIGFVPLHQAMIYKMKKDEGVPPSVILLGINSHTIAVTIYKIGGLVGLRDIEKHEDVSTAVEEGLKSFTDLEVLPARVLLYGSDPAELDEIKVKLLRHQWTSKVNFLHFPKIEVISLPMIIEAVSLAGASELGSAMGGLDDQKEPTPAVAVAPVASVPEEEIDTQVAVADSTPADIIEEQNEVAQEIEAAAQTDANVVMVDAESLGFKKDVDILEEENQLKAAQIEEEEEEYGPEEDTLAGRRGFAVPGVDVFGFLEQVRGFFMKKGRSGNRLVIALGVLVVIVLLSLTYWFLPRASVTILQIPKIIEEVETISIDPTATIVDAQNKIVPGKKREKSTSGEKTMPVNGKKNIGDPAKGTVTIYNKSLALRTFKKGAILSAGSLQFTLDSDVQVASASESVGSITFGKADVNVTAIAIGTPSNLPSGGEFTFKDVPSAIAIARNDKAFAGGNSKEVTVVSRSDYDNFVKIVSEELVDKAKQELASSVEGEEKLVDSTIKTTVTEKVFSQEIDEEATELQGKLTLAVSGIAYSETDIRALLTTIASDTIPSGYAIHEGKTTTNISNVEVKKDGKMTAKAVMSSTALPILDVSTLKKGLAGKSLKDVETYLRGLAGVGGVEVVFRLSPTKSRLPANKQNITITIAIAE